LFLQASLETLDCAIGEVSSFGPRARDKSASLGVWHFFGRVVGLAEFVSKNFNEMDTLTRKN
jgi:hypothetical protein